MSIPKKGGYSGRRPASEMGPPANLPSATIRPRQLDRSDGCTELTCPQHGERNSWPTPTLTVTDFVLARIAEDEAAHPCEYEALWDVHAKERACCAGDPVLAQCAAMRKIVERAGECDEAPIGGYCHCCETTLRALASIWSDHPDWREEWA